MYADYAHGGMSIVNVSVKLDALHVKHIYSLIKGTAAKWRFFAIYWIGFRLYKFLRPYQRRILLLDRVSILKPLVSLKRF